MSEEKLPLPELKDVIEEVEDKRDQILPAPRPYRVSVEVPCLVLYYCTTLTGTVMMNLLIHRTCVNQLGHSDEYCQRLQEPGEKPPELQDLEVEIQRFTTLVSMVKAVMDGVIPAILALFLGAWSNKYGRKPLIVWPAFGFALSTGLATAYSYVGSLGPWWYVFTSLPYSVIGAGPAFLTGAFCLLNDVSSEKSRTVRLAIMQSSVLTGTFLGSLSSSFLYEALGTSNLLLVATCLSVASFLFCVFFIKESVLKTESASGLSSVLDISLVKDMFRTCFKRRPSYGRLVLILLILVNAIDLFVNHGTGHIEYLYVRQKLSWTLKEQTIFGAINTVVLVFGLFFGVAFLQRLCKISDEATTIISYASCALEGIARALANAVWIMYFGSAISVFRGLSFPLVRSIISKRVYAQDVAKIFAFMSAFDATLPLVAPLFYNTVYRQTLATLPGTAFIVNTGLYIICVVIMWVVWRVIVRHPLQKTLFETAHH